MAEPLYCLPLSREFEWALHVPSRTPISGAPISAADCEGEGRRLFKSRGLEPVHSGWRDPIKLPSPRSAIRHSGVSWRQSTYWPLRSDLGWAPTHHRAPSKPSRSSAS